MMLIRVAALNADVSLLTCRRVIAERSLPGDMLLR